jgi:hypothetical protein
LNSPLFAGFFSSGENMVITEQQLLQILPNVRPVAGVFVLGVKQG